MLHPSYTDLIQIVNDEAESDTPVVNSRYTIVMATAKRARQIIAEGDEDASLLSDHSKVKPLSQAVEELSNGTLRILPEEAQDEEETAAAAAETEAQADAAAPDPGTMDESTQKDAEPETAEEKDV